MKEGLTRRQKIAGVAFWAGVVAAPIEYVKVDDPKILIATIGVLTAGLLGGIRIKRTSETAAASSHQSTTDGSNPWAPTKILEGEFTEIKKS